MVCSGCRLADEGDGFGAEEAGDLGGEGLDGGPALGNGGVVELKGLAPDVFDERGDVAGGEIGCGEVLDGVEKQFGLGLVLVRRCAV